MPQRPPVRLTPAQIAAMARARGLDPDAVLRVAGAEGLSGGIGDQGHAYGPFQLNNAGGVITRSHPGTNDPRIQNWAWSQPGIAYALDQIAGVAKGLHGRSAVENIVRRFERPANPEGEIARALAGSGYSAGGGVPAVPGRGAVLGAGAGPASVGLPATRGNPLLQVIRSTRRALGVAPSSNDMLARVLSQRVPAAAAPGVAPVPPSPAGQPVSPQPRGGTLAELLHEGVGGATHSTGEHIHAASENPQVVLALIREAQRRGLSVRENPYTDPVDPAVHAPRSFHKRTFPGLYQGRKLGEAVDVSGPGMSAYEAWVRRTYRR